MKLAGLSPGTHAAIYLRNVQIREMTLSNV
jgi:hypothetical protein